MNLISIFLSCLRSALSCGWWCSLNYKGCFLFLPSGSEDQWGDVRWQEISQRANPSQAAGYLFQFNWVALGKSNTFFGTKIDVLFWYLEYLWNTGQGATSQAAYIGYLSHMYSMSYFGTYIAVVFYFWNIDGTWTSLSGG